MLGIRLRPDEEERLERHARDVGRPKSALARDWIMDRLERESIDEAIRVAAKLHAEDFDRAAAEANTDAYLRWLDAEDGGYDWGLEGPPPVL